MRLSGIKRALGRASCDLVRHHTLQVAAGLSYYFALSVFPALIFLSAMLGLLPIRGFFDDVLAFMSRIIPPDSMGIVRSVLRDVLVSHHGTWLSLGMLGSIWTTSTGFAAIIEALDIAYDVDDGRPYWKTRALATGLAFLSGGLFLVALAVIIVGPRFGDWLAAHVGLSAVFGVVWPALRWTIAISFTVLAVELIYFFGPNVQQRFRATLPGAIVSVAVWNGLSVLMEIYFAHFAHFNRTYGTLAGFIAFMTWLYWTSFALLVGAELNSELAKQSRKGAIPPKGEASLAVDQAGRSLRPAA